ncbi:hypothetical protein JZU71_00095, partial [bacterium]|nr:hypothetical protein [bacterium]
WKTAFNTIQKAIDAANDNTQIWISEGVYHEKIKIEGKRGLYIYGGFSGKEKMLSDYNPQVHRSVIDGQAKIDKVLSIDSSEYIRIDGLQVKGGRNLADGVRGNGAGVC